MSELVSKAEELSDKTLDPALESDLRAAAEAYRAAEQRLDQSRAQLDARQSELDARQSELDARQSELEKRDGVLSARAAAADKRDAEMSDTASALREHESALNKAQTLLGKDRKKLDQREAKLREQEAEARAGFQALHDRWRSDLADEEARRREELDQLAQEIREAREQATADAHAARAEALLREQAREAAHREQLDAAFSSEREALQKERLALVERERELAYREEDYAEDAKALESDRRHQQARVEALAADAIREAEETRNRLKEQLEQLREHNDKLQRELELAREPFVKIGETPKSLEELKRRLLKDNEELREKLADLSDSVGRERVAELEARVQQAQRQRAEAERERDVAVRQAAAVKRSATELEAERDIRKTLAQANAATRQALDELSEQYASLLTDAKAKSPFPACLDMDEKYAQPSDGKGPDLKRFVGDLQHAMATATTAEDAEHFLYAEEDIRAFVGGLAMGQLILLKGVSGTGKTNLPTRFARAVGGRSSIVSVQAGWRDRYDLLGSYNAFSRVFDERPFMKALYAAHTPQWSDLINIIVLDEMNLSYFEQYGADVLSALESPAGQRALTLHSSPLTEGQLPKSLRYDESAGVIIPLPNNVWLVGTANEDETTKSFADKTFDRAQVIELERRGEFTARAKNLPVLSASKLRDAFEHAIRERSGDAEDVQKVLDETLAPHLREHFGAKFGSRVTRHIKRYVPVNVALGGNAGEAFDHLIATQLLRKVCGRFDTRVEQFDELRNVIETVGDEFSHEPIQTLRAIDDERKNLENR